MIYLTFDTDHMNEDHMSKFLATIDFPGKGTFFCTQAYRCLSQTEHEIAPHPFLESQNNWEDELQKMRNFFSDAKGWRSHSCVFSHLLALWLLKNNYKYVSTHDNFGAQGIKPHRHMWGIWHFPIYYMDNMDFSRHLYWGSKAGKPFAKELILNAINGTGVYIFDFHPIHLLLNTPSPEFYFEKRDAFKKGVCIDELRFTGYGAANFFMDLCTEMKQNNFISSRLDELLHELEENYNATEAA